MKYSILFSLLIVFVSLSATEVTRSIVIPRPSVTGDGVVPNDEAYFTYKLAGKDIELIYTKDNQQFAKHTLSMEEKIHNDYEKFFHWTFDETLYVGLISQKNQIANGFSTQWPNNRQINYMGGTILTDYFSNTSWLDVLLYHETAHNYQLNVKGSKVSQFLHSVFGNGSFLLPLPWVIIPNVVENSFMLEGNAVLNESWHGSGGRLYNGRFKAMMMLQAKAGNITPAQMYNSKLGFPYAGNIYYQIGGFYNLYLAEKHGTQTLNKYFYKKSKDWWFPFYTNATMEATIGSDFETSLKEFSDFYAKQAQALQIVQGKKLTTSQFYTPLSSNEEEIFFLTNETGYRVPELVVLNKSDERVTKKRASWIPGKVLKSDGKYYTQGSHFISPTQISQGLFDKDALLKDDSASKMVQGYLSDGRAVYFDVASSYDTPQLYVGKEYYGYTNSSVFIDKNDNIYYFANKAKGKERTLYKNKTPLYIYEGFYGIVADVDSLGAIYFIANSKLGATLYRYKNAKVTRASSADNIIEARLINDKEVLVSAVNAKEYYYVKNTLETIEEEPFNTKLFFEDEEYYGQDKETKKVANEKKLDTSNPYNALLDMHYSGANFSIGQSTSGAVIGSLEFSFGDPLTQNSANIFITRDESNVTLAGLGYENSQYLLQYSFSAYSVVDDGDRLDTRSAGIIAGVHLPFLRRAYYSGSADIRYFQDYDTAQREPLTASVSFDVSKHFGVSMYKNFSDAISLYGVKEREDYIVGGAYDFRHDLGGEFYLNLGAKYSQTDLQTNDFLANVNSRGVKVSLFSNADMDPATIVMPSTNYSTYWKKVGYGEAGVAKVINLSSYYFTFPLSLQRESIYANYRYYDLQRFSGFKEKVNEVTLGLRMDVVLFNSAVVPFSLEYYHNDNLSVVENENQVKFLLGTSF